MARRHPVDIDALGRMGRAQRNPSGAVLKADDGFRCALPILRALHLRFRLNRDPQACLERIPQERERIADVNLFGFDSPWLATKGM